MTPAEPTVAIQVAHSVEDELLRLLASTAAVREREQERMLELLDRANYGSLWRAMHAQNCTPLLGSRLLEIAGGDVSTELRRRIAEAQSFARTRGMAFEALTVRLVRELADAGVRALPLKGAVLAARVHGDAGLRLAGDIDVLVAPDDLQKATEILVDSGYERPSDVLWHDELPDLHFTFVATNDWRPPLELHWRIHWYEDSFSESMLERSVADDRFARLPTPADDFGSLLLFLARDSFQGLRLVADIAAWWDRFGDQLPPGALEPLAEAHPSLAPSLIAAAHVVEDLVGVPAPRLFSPSRRLKGRAGLAVRLGNWRNELPEDQVAADVTLIDLLLAPRGRRHEWARRNIVQPLDHIASARGLESRPRAELAARSAVHALAVSARFAPKFARGIARARSTPLVTTSHT